MAPQQITSAAYAASVNMRDVIAACMATVRAREIARQYAAIYHTDGSYHIAHTRAMDSADLDLWFALEGAR